MESFSHQVYQLVSRIPEGKVASYGQIAALLGKPRGARIVGYIMANTPAQLHIPCHRVVNRHGALAPDHVFGNRLIQRQILEREGVTFLVNGCIDMKKHLWFG